MKFIKMYNVKNNRELKKVNGNVILDVRTRNTEDLLDINRQIWRLEKKGYKVIIQSPKGNLLPSRALGKYTKEHVNIEVPVNHYYMNIKSIDMTALEAKLTNLKGMMSHKEYIEIPEYEESDCISAFDHKIPRTDCDGNVITNTVEKTVYLDRLYTFTINGKIVNHYGFIRRLAKSFKIPLATVIGDQIVDPDDESYLLSDCTEDIVKLINEKYKTITPVKKEMLLKFFGTHNSEISEYEDFSYAMINFKMFRFDDLALPNKVDAEEFMNMLESFKVPNAYELLTKQAERGMCRNLGAFPELAKYETAVYYERYSSDEEDDDILD